MKSVTHLLERQFAAKASTLHPLRGQLQKAIEIVKVWRRRVREREELRRYCVNELRGLPGDLADAARIECEKPFWEA